MKPCRQVRRLFTEALYNNLEPGMQRRFDDHLASCAKCAKAFRRMKRTLAVMDHRVRVEPPPQFWDQYWDRLQQRMQTEKPVVEKPVVIKRQWQQWIYRAAAVVMLVGLGVVLGRMWVPSSTSIVDKGSHSSAPEVVPASFDQRTQDFLGRSEVLLLGLVNYDPETEETASLDLSRQKEVSQGLIQEAAYLKQGLSGRGDRRLQKLVGDLELILLQIANLEEREDLPEIDLVKSGVDNQGLLLKINLEQMRTAKKDTRAMSKEPSGKKGI